MFRDYQGSIIAVTTDDGNILQKQFFDAWGKMTNYYADVKFGRFVPSFSSEMYVTDRGYTGHEMLLGVGLINMNARLYDPKLHRFLSPDSITDYSNTQSLNGYNYCYDNPLKYTDESGNWAGWDDAGAFIFGGLINWGMNGFQLNAAGMQHFAVGGVGGLAILYGGPINGVLAASAITGAGNSIINQTQANGKVDFGKVLGDAIISVAISAAFIGLGQAINGIFKAPPKIPLETVNKLPTPEIVVSETVAPAMDNFTITTTTATGAANTAAGTVTNTTKELAKAGLVKVTDNVGREIVGAGIVNLDEVVVQGAKGSFSISNWAGYPLGGIKPIGPFRVLEGLEYTNARNLANSTNQALRNSNPSFFKGLEIHEIQPVKFNGSPTDLNNKLFLTPTEHRAFSNYWIKQQYNWFK